MNATELQSNLAEHHIEGLAREDTTQTPLDVPLITPVDDMLWQGGCAQGANLQGYFKHIISLYPWEQYNPGGPLDSLLEVRLIDGPVVPDEQQLYTIAAWVNLCRQSGRTLVHCQAGLNRSGLVTGLALVMGGLMPVDAIALLRTARCPQVLCNRKFAAWLLRQEAGGQNQLDNHRTVC